MEFITIEQFKEQPKEVQKVFLDWWKPSIGDIFSFIIDEYDNSDCNIGVLSSEKQIRITNTSKGKYRIPLFIEGQLRKFIEDKTFCKSIEVFGNVETCEYDIYLYPGIYSHAHERKIESLGDNILQAYWKAACMIAKEEVGEKVI